jgi:osmotically-inducible protein OsmY
MKKSLIICLCVLMSGLLMQSCGPDDVKIATDVKNVLLLNHPQASSSVRNGIVTLTGVVDSEEKKADAETLVKEIDGVKSVVNDIEVKASVGDINRDLTLKATINNALYGAKITTIEVEVASQVVTLKGEAKKGDQKRIMDMVKQTGTTEIVDNVTWK